MKKILSVLTLALCATMVMGQQAVITFERTEHDFGKINEADGRVTTVFEFKNEGMEPLVLSNVRASCGCTTPNWTREPIEPGQTGKITVTYNPNGRPGRFQKTVTITSNATEATTHVYIKGEVIPKPAKPVNQYPVQMGELSLKAKSVNFGTVKKGQKINHEIEYANHTDHEITVDLATRAEDNFLISQVTLGKLQPNETGKLMFVFDSEVCKLYGPVEISAFVEVNGKAIHNDEYKLSFKAEVDEDFSNLSVADRQQAPILEMQDVIDLGEVPAGKKVKKSVVLQNAGVNPLLVHRAYNKSEFMTVLAPKGALKSGKKGELKIELTAIMDGEPMPAGSYSREIVIITNDPNQPKKTVKVAWQVL